MFFQKNDVEQDLFQSNLQKKNKNHEPSWRASFF